MYIFWKAGKWGKSAFYACSALWYLGISWDSLLILYSTMFNVFIYKKKTILWLAVLVRWEPFTCSDVNRLRYAFISTSRYHSFNLVDTWKGFSQNAQRMLHLRYHSTSLVHFKCTTDLYSFKAWYSFPDTFQTLTVHFTSAQRLEKELKVYIFCSVLFTHLCATMVSKAMNNGVKKLRPVVRYTLAEHLKHSV